MQGYIWSHVKLYGLTGHGKTGGGPLGLDWRLLDYLGNQGWLSILLVAIAYCMSVVSRYVGT